MSLRELLLQNFRLKLFSLVLAVLIWESINLTTSQNPEARPFSPANGPTNSSALL